MMHLLSRIVPRRWSSTPDLKKENSKVMSDSGSVHLGVHADARYAIPTNRGAPSCETNSEGRSAGLMPFKYPYRSSRPVIPKNRINSRQRAEEEWTSKRMETYDMTSQTPGTYTASNYIVWRNSYGSTTSLAADGDNNHAIDQADYDIWKMNFGKTSGSGAALASVPEPASARLLVVALFVGVGAGTTKRRNHACLM
jgi:hypothetical protein